MNKSIELLKSLNIKNYTIRHLKAIDHFLISKETDCKKLLDNLGDWDNNDLKIAENWLKEVKKGRSI